MTYLRLYLAEEYILIHATFLAWIHDVQVLPTLENHDILISLLSVPAQLEKGKQNSKVSDNFYLEQKFNSLSFECYQTYWLYKQKIKFVCSLH